MSADLVIEAFSIRLGYLLTALSEISYRIDVTWRLREDVAAWGCSNRGDGKLGSTRMILQ
jgi:hypothetical protein